tara:strand:- start:4447 stop:5340 length:894 start_codon:yes stop_codon:yes gene_type:complete
MPPDPSLNKNPSSRGQAMVNQAQARRANLDKIENFQDEDQDYKDKLSFNSGWGRFIGAAVLGGITLATGGTNLAIAAAAGIGSRIGNEGGEYLADKYKPEDLKVEDINYYKDDVKQINRDREQFDKDFDTNQWMDAGRDAWTAYTMASSASKYGAKVTTLADGSKVYAKQTAKEGVKNMWGDTAEWGKSLVNKVGGDKTSEKVAGKLLPQTIERGGSVKETFTKGKQLLGKGKKIKQMGTQLTGEQLRNIPGEVAGQSIKNKPSAVSNALQLLKPADTFVSDENAVDASFGFFNQYN